MSDWEDDEPSKFFSTSSSARGGFTSNKSQDGWSKDRESSNNGFGSSNRGGRGGGRGRGRGSQSPNEDGESNGFGSSDGFGSRGGFGSSDGFGDPGFGSGGGFGASDGYGSGNRKFGSGSNSRPGDWTCDCGDNNFASRSECRKCGASRPAGAGNSGNRGGGGNSRPGDWTCDCGENNFASRSECRKCSNSRPGGGGNSGNRDGGSNSRPGDWTCDCGENNFASRSECRKCGSSNPGSTRNDGNFGGGDKPREVYVPPTPSENEQDIFKSMTQGINFDKYDAIEVAVTGADVIKRGLSSFEEGKLAQKVLDNVKKAGYTKPTPVQKYAIPVINNGRDVMGCAQTGSGKTAAFLLPILTGIIQENLIEGNAMLDVQKPAALIVGPTRELVVQIYNEARKFSFGTSVRPVVVYGGTSVGHQLRQVENGTHILIGTTGRLVDFLDRGKIILSNIKYLILDEADRMLDMGFGADVKKIVSSYGMPNKTVRQTLMFSATFPGVVQNMAKNYLENYVMVTVGKVGGANTDIEQTILCISRNEKREKLIELLGGEDIPRTLIFAATKRQTDFLACQLSQQNLPATSIHGDRLQREREQALSDFKSGVAPILVATSVAARGLDIPAVMHVINYDLPDNEDEYVHRIGRTGRCGNVGRATSFFDPDKDSELARPLLKVLSDAQQQVPGWLEQSAIGTGGGFSNNSGGFGALDNRANDGGAPSYSSFSNQGDEDWD